MADQPPGKDLTALLDHMKVLEAQGLLPKAPGGEAAVTEKKIEPIQAFDSLDEYVQKNPLAAVAQDSSQGAPAVAEIKIEPIQEFESLEEYAQKNPPAEPTALEPSPEPESAFAEGSTESALPGLLDSSEEPSFIETASNESASATPLIPTEESLPFESAPEGITEKSPATLAAEIASEMSGEHSALGGDPLSTDSAPGTFPSGEEILPSSIEEPALESTSAPGEAASPSSPTPESEPKTLTVSTRTPLPPQELLAARPFTPAGGEIVPPAKLGSKEVLRNARSTAEAVPSVPIDQPLPFTVRIEGMLKAEERAPLLALLESEKFPIDLKGTEMQLDAGRVLIPRISEYAAIAIVRCLRAAAAQVTLAPSEEPELSQATPLPQTQWEPSTSSHAADELPIVTFDLRDEDWQSRWPGARLDSLIVSLVLVSAAVEVEESEEFKEALERLKQELRYRAHFKNAFTLGNLRETLTPLPQRPLHYRLSLSATAVLPAAKPIDAN